MATIAYGDYYEDSSNRTTYTATGLNFGTAESDRKIIIVCAARDDATRTVSSATIGGVTATKIVEAAPTGFSGAHTILIADVPTGTTGDVVVTYNSQMSDFSVAVYKATGLVSSTATDTLAGTGSLDVSRGGIIVASSTIAAPNSQPTWSGVTYDYHDRVDNTWFGSSASQVYTETSIAQTVSCSWPTGGDTAVIAASFPAYSEFTNPGNVYSSNNTYATCAATSGDLTVEVSKDGGETYSSPKTVTFTGSDTTQTCGTGSTELWGMSFTRADMVDANFRVRITHGTYSQVIKTFGFVTGTDTLTGIEIAIEGNYASSTISIDHIKVKIYYGTSILPIQAGSQAFASNGRKNGEGAGAGTGVLVFHDGTAWRACDTGATVAA